MSDPAPTGDELTQDDVAAGIFTALLTMALGGTGLLIAALAVGVERAWNGRGGHGRRGERAGEYLGDQRAWLDMDAKRRAEWRERRRQWWADGADPAARPSPSPARVGFGRWARRAWARVAVGAAAVAGALGRFGSGFLAGWRNANRVRRDTTEPQPGRRTRFGRWWRRWVGRPWGWVRRTRVGRWVGRGWAWFGGTRVGRWWRRWAGRAWAAVRRRARAVRRAVRRFRKIAGARPTPAADQAPDPEQPGQPDPAPADQPTTGPGAPTPAGQPTGSSTPDQAASPQPQEDPVTQSTTAPAAQGETNLDLTAQDLERIRTELAGVNEQVDALAQRRATLQGLITQAQERVTATGGTAATAQALDAAQQVVNNLGQHVGNVSESAVEAEDVTAAAHAGLAPAQDAQDALHAAGATGEFVAAATHD